MSFDSRKIKDMGFWNDYFIFIGVITFVTFIRVLVYMKTTPLNEFGEKKVEHAKVPDEDIVDKIKNNYDLNIKPKQEREVKIKAIFLYPVRGIRGMKVDNCEITPYGLKNDRNWVIIGCKKMKPLANHNSHLITYLR